MKKYHLKHKQLQHLYQLWQPHQSEQLKQLQPQLQPEPQQLQPPHKSTIMTATKTDGSGNIKGISDIRSRFVMIEIMAMVVGDSMLEGDIGIGRHHQ